MAVLMGLWINNRLSRASWIGLAVWFVLLFGYSYVAFVGDTPWTRALAAAGGLLPETQPGFPPVEPARSFEAMGVARNDYLLFQAIDFPYAFFNLMVLGTAIALGLRKWGLARSPLRFALLPPLVYFIAELIENPLLVSFASGALAPGGVTALVQQGATTVKFLSMGLGAIAGLIGVLGAAVASLTGQKSAS